MPAKMFRWRALLVTLGVVALVSVALLPLVAQRAASREIVIVAREMAFFVEGDTTPNPVIRVRRGEHVTLTFRNEAVGISHDFAIGAWGVATRQIQGASVDRVSFTVPEAPGTVEYVCSPHSAMMRGSIVIE